jgi:hypothetical protein
LIDNDTFALTIVGDVLLGDFLYPLFWEVSKHMLLNFGSSLSGLELTESNLEDGGLSFW